MLCFNIFCIMIVQRCITRWKLNIQYSILSSWQDYNLRNMPFKLYVFLDSLTKSVHNSAGKKRRVSEALFFQGGGSEFGFILVNALIMLFNTFWDRLNRLQRFVVAVKDFCEKRFFSHIWYRNIEYLENLETKYYAISSILTWYWKQLYFSDLLFELSIWEKTAFT